jgi:hypothetical protein
MLNERRANKLKNMNPNLPLGKNVLSSWTISNSIKVKDIEQEKAFEAKP